MTEALSWIDPEPYQECPGCKIEHPVSSFVADDGQPTTHCSRCSAKMRPRVRRPQQRTPAAIRAQHLRQKYGITVEDYDVLRAAQGYRCAICGTHEDNIRVGRTGRPRKDGTPTAEGAKLVVDHCHDSGRVRGLLCGGCNSAIGHFKDSPAVMLAAIEYVRRNPACPN